MLVVFGSINVDLVARVPRLPRRGETLAGNRFATVPGGKGANQAVVDEAMQIFEECVAQGWVVDGTLSQSETQARALWRLREDISETISHYTPYKNDLSVTIARVPAFIAEIDAIVAARYPDFRIVWFGHIGDGNLHLNILKPDNMGKDEFFAKCATVNQNNIYRDGLRYAMSKLAPLPNVYMYLDIAHSGWLGWDNNRSKAVEAYKALVAGATPSGDLSIIRGFATNIANYSPLDEPYFDGTDSVVSTGGTTQFYEWNRAVDELTYIDKLRTELVAAGFAQDLGFIVDTGRNGWGGPNRPTAAAADVDDMRIDRRAHRGNWCNVKNTGIGERPRAKPDATRSHLDAYVFIKPPGASDGTSDSTATTPNDEGKRFDAMCGSSNVDALPNAPHAGHWFHDQFLMLLGNAYPPLN